MAPGSSVFLSGGTHGCCRAEGLSRAARCPLLGQHLSSSPRGVAGCEQTDRRTEHPPERRPAPRPGAVPSRAGMLRALWASFHRSAFPGRIFSSHGWTWDVNPPPPPRDGTRVSPHGRRPRLPAPPLPLPLPSFAFWVLGQLRPVLVQPARWAPNSETGVGVGGGDSKRPFPKKLDHGGPAVPAQPDPGRAAGPQAPRTGPAGTPSRN